MELNRKFLKYLTLVLNGMLLIFGIILTVLASVEMSLRLDTVLLGTIPLGRIAAINMVLGLLTIVVAAVGCAGAWRETQKMIYGFVACIFVFSLLQSSMVYAAKVLRSQDRMNFIKHFHLSFVQNKSPSNQYPFSRYYWDRIQTQFQCCGVSGPEDYFYPPVMTQGISCCPLQTFEESPEVYLSSCINDQLFYRTGCEQKILVAIYSTEYMDGIRTILFGIFVALSMSSSLLLVRKMKKAEKTKVTAEMSNKDGMETVQISVSNS